MTSQSQQNQFDSLSDYQQNLILAGLSPNITIEELSKTYLKLILDNQEKDQSAQIFHWKQIYERTLSISKEYEKKYLEMEKQVYKSNSTIHSLQSTVINQKLDITNLQDNFIKHSNHTNDCNYIDAIEVGRIGPKDLETDLCSCGFSKIKQEILGLLKKEEPKVETTNQLVFNF